MWLAMGRLKQAPAWLLLLVLVVMTSFSMAARIPESSQLRIEQEQSSTSSSALNTYYFEAMQPQVEVLPPTNGQREGTTRLRVTMRKDRVGKSMPIVTGSAELGLTHNVADTWAFLKVCFCVIVSFGALLRPHVALS
jgi:hypothetical protein